MRVQRFDVGGELRKPVRDPKTGWLRCDGYITRAGVFTYKRPNGTDWKEYRPPEEVLKADAVASFALVPLTNGHPREGLLTAENTAAHQRGIVNTPTVEGDRVRARIVVTDADTIADLEAGKVQLSGGYTCALQMTPGTDPKTGERYDCVQRNIHGNHVALVAVGRAGLVCRVRMDSLDGELDTEHEDGDDPVESARRRFAALVRFPVAVRTGTP